MMSYTFSELLEWADSVSGIYSLVTHKKSSMKIWGMGKKCTGTHAQQRAHVRAHSYGGADNTVDSLSLWRRTQPVVAPC